MRQILVILGVMALGGGLFWLGYGPRLKREVTVRAATEGAPAALKVRIDKVKAGKAEEDLELPGTLDSRKESPVYARAEGYIRARLVGFGDRVKAGQVLVEIDSPEIEREYQRAKAALSQARAALPQAEAALKQAVANRKIAAATYERWQRLVAEGVISKQEGEEREAALEARLADVAAAEAAMVVAREAIDVREAELKRVEETRAFQKVTAPFDGVITARSCEVGNLITPGALAAGRELFKISQISNIRVLIDVPEIYVPRVRAGQKAELRFQGYPGEAFPGAVSRISNEVDRESRTMTIEVLTEDPKDRLRPGMYAQVRLVGTRRDPAVVVPGDAIVTRQDGLYVAAVRGGKVKFQKIAPGRDLGAEVEVLGGLKEGDAVVVSPSDEVREGVAVEGVR
jgi:RND family efflux transporter MFP subunit